MQNMANIEYKNIDAKAKSCMRVVAAIWNIVLFVAVIIVLMILSSEGVIADSLFIGIAALVFAVCLAYVIVAPSIRYKRYRYFIDDDMLVVVEGLFFVTKSIAPIERIHQIAVKRGPIDRLYGMSNVVVTTAGGEVKIAFLDNDVAEEIADRLRVRVNGLAKAAKEEEGTADE